jgi:hypothetical protein
MHLGMLLVLLKRRELIYMSNTIGFLVLPFKSPINIPEMLAKNHSNDANQTRLAKKGSIIESNVATMHN